MRTRFAVATLALCAACALAGSVTFTYVEHAGDPERMVVAFETTTNAAWVRGTSKWINGWCDRVDVLASSPTGAAWTLQIENTNGIDLLNGAGAGLASNTVTPLCPGFPRRGATTTNATAPCFNSPLVVVVTNFGSSTTTNAGGLNFWFHR